MTVPTPPGPSAHGPSATGPSAAGPSAPTLTDHYVEAALRGCRGAERADLDRELRASITDAVEHRARAGLEAGLDTSLDTTGGAERKVLEELGDPLVLSARYRNVPTHLVGPRTYPTWRRWTGALLLGVLPVVTVLRFSVEALSAGSVSAALGPTIGGALNLAVWLIAVPTLICYLVERYDAADTGDTSGTGDTGYTRWSVDDLPAAGPRARTVEMLVLVGLTALGAAAVVFQDLVGLAGPDGAPVPVLDPQLWSGPIPTFLVGLAAAALVVIARRRAGRDTTGLLIATLAVRALLFGIPLVLAWQGNLLAPALVAALGAQFDPATANLTIAVIVAGLMVWSLLAVLRRHRGTHKQ